MQKKPGMHKKQAEATPTVATLSGFEPPAMVPEKVAAKRFRDKTKPPGATQVGLEPCAQGSEKEEVKCQKFMDTTRWSWFALHTQDSAFKFRVSVALEVKKLPANKSAVEWDTLNVLADGFVLRWRQAALIRAGHMWWARLLQRVIGSRDAQWEVRGYLEKPGWARLSAGNPVPPAPREQVASQASSHPWKPQDEDDVALLAPEIIGWPKFKTRRLTGFWTGSQCPVGIPAKSYTLRNFLGEGSYGKVYRDSIGGQDLAIKCFEDKNRHFALQEASVAEQLCDHPHICRLLDAFRRPDKVSCLIYAFAGQSVGDVLKGSPGSPQLPSSHIHLCVAHVLKGIAHMHSLGLYHGDLKPANVLMQGGEQPHFVVADLGSIVEVGRGVMHIAHTATTMWYRSPEILLGQRSALGDHWLRADVWALGITMAQACGLDFFKVCQKTKNAAKQLHDKLRLTVGASPGADWPNK